MAIHNDVADDEKFEAATTTYVYVDLEGILGGYLVGGTQQQASPESLSWSWRLMASSWFV
jgi:hypothetical protein